VKRERCRPDVGPRQGGPPGAEARLQRTLPPAALLALSAALAACEWSELVVLPSEQEGGVTRPGLSVVVVLEEEYAPLAEALGWNGLVVPSADFAAAPRGEELEWEEVVADEDGRVDLPHLLPGDYSVTASRRLTDEEQALLAEAGIDARMLGGGGILRAPGQDEEPQPLEVQPDEPGSLVISELMYNRAQVPPDGGGTYFSGFFIELYNNSDTTIYLDGKLIGEGLTAYADFSDARCSRWGHLRNNPTAVFAMDIQAFPGTGRDYPIGPGEVVTVASEAIDHSQFGPNLLDLAGADFELDRPGGADNPHVPNMIHVGTRWHPYGLPFPPTAMVPFVAEALDVDALPRVATPGELERLQIPGEAVLDLFAHRLRWISPVSGLPCDALVHRNFERLEAVLGPTGYSDGRSLQRKVAGARPDGRPILKRTRTSMLDLFYGAWTPHELPRDPSLRQ